LFGHGRQPRFEGRLAAGGRHRCGHGV
jgi:hypothetical protein